MSFTVREARLEDYDIYARLFVEFALAEPAPPLEWWRARLDDAFFVEEDAQVVGFGLCSIAGDEGLVINVITDPGARRRGVGTFVMERCAARFRARGLTRWSLYVKEDNVGAIALYRKLGMAVLFSSKTFALPVAKLAELPRDEAVSVAALDRADVDRVERALDLRGRIARFMSFAGRDAAVAREGDEVVGFAAIERARNAFPLLRVRTPAVATRLFSALDPDDGEIRIQVDDDEALAALLAEHGAKLVVRMHRMAGPLPRE